MTATRDSRAAIRTSRLQSLMIVCHGNIYRSPYSAELLRTRLATMAQVRSSGFHDVVGRPSPQQHVIASLQSGVDLRAHRSSKVTAADLAWADAIVLMDRHNWQALRELGADPRRLIWLGTLDGDGEIPDPYGVPEDEALRIMQRVHRCTEALAAVMLERKGSPPC